MFVFDMCADFGLTEKTRTCYRIKRQVITALASLGEQIQAPLIAEGIEQPEELHSLLSLGVRMGQGFLLGRPQVRCARTVH